MVTQPKNTDWVLLSYRIPREPSTPRIAVWRQLKELGVAQLGDGLVALPLTDRNREQLEWVSAKVQEADGEATVWIAAPSTRRDTKRIATELNDARTAEYSELLTELEDASRPDPRTIARWRREYRRIDRRDYFGASGRDDVRLALDGLADAGSDDKVKSR